MTPALSAVYEELLVRASRPPHQARSTAWRAEFDARTGVFPLDHPSFGARVAAGWEDALIAGGLAKTLVHELHDPAERALAQVLARAQQGVFCAEKIGDHHAVRDLWDGGLFALLPRDELSRAETGGEETFFLGRIVAGIDGCAVLPGRVWIPGEAAPHLEGLLDEAARRDLTLAALTDALLRMDHTYATLSRVKVNYAFRAASLPPAKR